MRWLEFGLKRSKSQQAEASGLTVDGSPPGSIQFSFYNAFKISQLCFISSLSEILPDIVLDAAWMKKAQTFFVE